MPSRSRGRARRVPRPDCSRAKRTGLVPVQGVLGVAAQIDAQAERLDVLQGPVRVRAGLDVDRDPVRPRLLERLDVPLGLDDHEVAIERLLRRLAGCLHHDRADRDLTDEMAAKRIELLKEVAPNARRVAVIFNPQHFDDEVTFARRGAESLGIELTTHPINDVADLDGALHAVSASGADSLLVISSRLTGIVAAKIAQYGQEHRLPVIASWREFVASGALLSYGPSRIFEAKRLAGYVQKVLNGEKPADLPIEQPVKFELVINLKTAKVLGLTVPPSLLGRADDVIE